jgi:hypothetical protein
MKTEGSDVEMEEFDDLRHGIVKITSIKIILSLASTRGMIIVVDDVETRFSESTT